MTETRVCFRCKVERDLTMFYVAAELRSMAKKGRKTVNFAQCRVCQREQNTARRRPKLEYANAIKLEHGCIDCGMKSQYPEVFDFDHMPGHVKAGNLSKMMMSGSLEQVIEEIAKCEVVCANCHRVRTLHRGQAGSSFGVDHGARQSM